MQKLRIHLARRLVSAFALLVLGFAVSVAQIGVSLPTVQGQTGASLTIPVTVGNLSGQNVFSYQFTVTFDTTIVKITGASISGTLSANFSTSVNTNVSGRITVAAAGSQALSGSGTLINLSANLVGKGSSNLTFTAFQFNEGSPAASLTNGRVVVPQLAVTIPTATQKLLIGSSITIPIATESVTGLNVLAYQFSVSFDTTKIKLTGISTQGTLSSTMTTTVNNQVSGRLTVGAASSTALTGSGTLINLTGTVTGYGTSDIKFLSIQYNEGTPAVGGVDGAVTIAQNQKPVLVSRTPASVSQVSFNTPFTFSVNVNDPDGDPITYTWKVDGVVEKTGTENSFTKTFPFASGIRSVVAVFQDSFGLRDSTIWQFTITSVEDGLPPTEFSLGQNYPNPFNPTTTIAFSIPTEANVTLEIFNVLGVKVRTLVKDQRMAAAVHQRVWDGKDDAGMSLPSGIYLYRIQAGSFVASKKMTLMK